MSSPALSFVCLFLTLSIVLNTTIVEKNHMGHFMNLIIKTLAILSFFAIYNISFADEQKTLMELEAYWKEASRTVREGDFEGYKATYHPDAILVSGPGKNSYPIATAFAGWKQGFMDTASGASKADVTFKFSSHKISDTTAHSTGMFYYFIIDDKGERTNVYSHFEALLVNKDGWKLMMEYQKSYVSELEWNEFGN